MGPERRQKDAQNYIQIVNNGKGELFQRENKGILTFIDMTAGVRTQNVEKLNETNFESWKFMTKSLLIFNSLWTYVNGTDVKTEENQNEWMLKNEKALALITSSVLKCYQ